MQVLLKQLDVNFTAQNGKLHNKLLNTYSQFAFVGHDIEVSMQRNFTSTFYCLSVKITLNRLVISFTEVRYFASFLRNYALSEMEVSYL